LLDNLPRWLLTFTPLDSRRLPRVTNWNFSIMMTDHRIENQTRGNIDARNSTTIEFQNDDLEKVVFIFYCYKIDFLNTVSYIFNVRFCMASNDAKR
jgi:hypothetical protein